MIIDHLGLFIFKDIEILRILGRISFALYAFLCAESMHYSKHKERYILCLFCFEIILSIVEYIFTKQYTSTIFITLALGASTIYFIQKEKWYIKLLALIPLFYALFASFNFTPFKVLYGFYGVIFILMFYLARLLITYYYKSVIGDNPYLEQTKIFHKTYVVSCSLLVVTISLITYFFYRQLSDYLPCNNMDYYIQSYTFLAIPFILLYSSKRGLDNKYIRITFYLAYPLNILIFYIISLFI